MRLGTLRRTALLWAVFLHAATAAAGPVVVELFTSQGCSSCPDADRLLSTWGLSEFRAGRILPLSFDVDYWDYLGWKDVFSAPAWSRRQAEHAAALHVRTYTPQMVAAGREAFVGSDAGQAAAAVGRFAGEPPRAQLALDLLPGTEPSLEIRVVPRPEAAGLHALLALFENGLRTDVARGENGGRVLRSDFVVRRLVDLGPVETGKTLRRRLDRLLDPAWNASNSGAALFLQDPETLAVYDARAFFPLAAAARTAPTIVALGDSTTAGTPLFASPLEAPPDGAGDEQSQYAYWIRKEHPRWRLLNRGINGERADQIRARFARDVEAERPAAVVVLAGVNDVYQGRPLAATEDDLLWMYRRAKGLGLVPVAATVLPFTRATAEQNVRLAALNRWIRETAAREKIPVCDAARAVADPKDPRRLAGSPDGLHPDVAGYRALGRAIAKTLAETLRAD